jgi:type IV secretory pathway component VirB8
MTEISKEEEYANNVDDMRRAFNNKEYQESSLHFNKYANSAFKKDYGELSPKESIDYLQHYMFVSMGRLRDATKHNFRILLVIMIIMIIMVIVILVFTTLTYNLDKKHVGSATI